MKFYSGVVIFLFLDVLGPCWTQTCLKFPFGHLCRNMDLTGFCMQVSHIMQIREKLSVSPPYTQFDKIFNKLESIKDIDRPYVHFGGYSKQRLWENCVKTRPVWMPPENGSMPEVRNISCKPNQKVGAPDPFFNMTIMATVNKTEDIVADKDYTGCKADCDCCIEPPDDTYIRGTIFTINDACELKYVKAPMYYLNPHTGEKERPAAHSMYEATRGSPAPENPYRIEITEISVEGVRLHNWLHFKLFSKGTVTFTGQGEPSPCPTLELGKGKIKMAFIQVTDATGLPVGEFVNDMIPCGTDCGCGEPACHQGKFDDTFPCMFDGKRVTSNTGMMLVYAKKDGCNEGMQQIHGTWRFTQSSSPESFTTQLQFWALVVDDFNKNYQMRVNTSTQNPLKAWDSGDDDEQAGEALRVNWRLSSLSERWTIKTGMFGWNPLFDILHPTVLTVGSYDYFREDVFDKANIKCHEPVDPNYYIVEPYPDSGVEIKQVANTSAKHCYRFKLNKMLKPPPPGRKKVRVKNVTEPESYCYDDPSASSKMIRHVKRCPGVPGVPSFLPDFLHDTYGFVYNGKTDPEQTYPWSLPGARIESYVMREGGIDEKDPDKYKNVTSEHQMYFGTEHLYPQIRYRECALDKINFYGKAQNHTYPSIKAKYDMNLAGYGHSCTPFMDGRRVLRLSTPMKKWPNVLAELWKFDVVDSSSYEDDRCFCVKPQDPADPTKLRPELIVLQARRQHAYQMIIAWNMIIPFAIFVSRYYKETYSKVFFLQEYWWYTTHVLCMASAAMFTFGGIYVLELKRRPKIIESNRPWYNWWMSVTYYWEDPATVAHMMIGIVIVVVFFAQSVAGFFRAKDARKRKLEIMIHWLLGVLEYVLAITCMILASTMMFSGMSCYGVAALVFLLILQIMFYASMEVHSRNIDRNLDLKPRRSYLPPPVMRIFHKDAPEAKFRVWILLAYGVLCVLTSILQMLALTFNEDQTSCFRVSDEFDRGDGTE